MLAGVFFEDDMRVGTAHSERTDAGDSAPVTRLPVRELVDHIEGAFGKEKFRVRFYEVDRGWQLPVL